MKVVFFKCEEIIVEDHAQDEVDNCFYSMDGVQVSVTDDEGNKLFDLNDTDVEYNGLTVNVNVPEGFYAHAIGWRTIEFDVMLKNSNHELTIEDFTWGWHIVNGYDYPVLELNPEVGELEFIASWDGRYDEDIE